LKRKFVIGGIILIAALGFLTYLLIKINSSYYITVDQFFSNESSYTGKHIRVEGFVKQDTIDWTSQDYNLKFFINDGQNNNPASLLVFYNGAKQDPNKFFEGVRVIVVGKYSGGNTFIANGLIYQCPNEFIAK